MPSVLVSFVLLHVSSRRADFNKGFLRKMICKEIIFFFLLGKKTEEVNEAQWKQDGLMGFGRNPAASVYVRLTCLKLNTQSKMYLR